MENTDNTPQQDSCPDGFAFFESSDPQKKRRSILLAQAKRMEEKMSKEQRIGLLYGIINAITILAGAKVRPGREITPDDIVNTLTCILEAGGFTAHVTAIRRETA